MKNIGVDIVENSRFAEKINDEAFISRIFSIKEKTEFMKINSVKRKIEFLSGRFASKEAIIKAINKTKLSFSYSDISVLNDEFGAPFVEFSFKVDFYILISISHSDTNTIATAIMI